MESFNLMYGHARPVIKASRTDDAFNFDPELFERVLGRPDKIQIPERYIPEAEPAVEPEEERRRALKAEAICRILSKSAVGLGGGIPRLPLLLPSRNGPAPAPPPCLNGYQSLPPSPLRRVVPVRKVTPTKTQRRPTSSCDWSLAGVNAPSTPYIYSRGEAKAGYSAPPTAYRPALSHSALDAHQRRHQGQGQPSPFARLSPLHSSSVSSTSSGGSSDREDFLHLQHNLAREVTERSRIVAVRALAESPGPFGTRQRSPYRPPSPPSPVRLPTVQQREGFFT